jgi:uncharacterized C2H2 Zn-finger protein
MDFCGKINKKRADVVPDVNKSNGYMGTCFPAGKRFCPIADLYGDRATNMCDVSFK